MGPSDRAGSLMAGRFFSPLLPLLCGFLAVILSNIPVTLVGGGLVPGPLLGLIPIYYWCLVRPDLMTPAATFWSACCRTSWREGHRGSGPWLLW